MNYSNGIEIIKSALCEYIENIISLSYPYMKKNHIAYDFSGQDNLSLALKILIEISNKIKLSNNVDEILNFKVKILGIEEKINIIIGGVSNGRK